MSVALPTAQIARDYAAGTPLATLARRHRVSTPTIMSRIRMHWGQPAWPRRHLRGVANPELYWRNRMKGRRFNDALTDLEVQQLRDLVGWSGQ